MMYKPTVALKFLWHYHSKVLSLFIKQCILTAFHTHTQVSCHNEILLLSRYSVIQKITYNMHVYYIDLFELR